MEGNFYILALKHFLQMYVKTSFGSAARIRSKLICMTCAIVKWAAVDVFSQARKIALTLKSCMFRHRKWPNIINKSIRVRE